MKERVLNNSDYLINTDTCNQNNLLTRSFLESKFPNGIKKILLITPPDGTDDLFQIATAKRGRYPNYPAYGLGLLATHLRNIGIDVLMINLNHEVLKEANLRKEEDFSFNNIWSEKLNEVIKNYRPDLACVTCMFTMTHNSLKAVCSELYKKSIPIAIGGVHVTNDIDNVLRLIPEVSFGFLKEADIAIRNFCRVVNKILDINDLKQVYISTGKQILKYDSSATPNHEDLDVIPAYDLMNTSELSNYGVMGNFYGFKPLKTKFSTVLSNRGCRAQCTFCSVRNFNGMGVRQRSVNSVLEEIDILYHEYGIRHIVWLDDDLLKDHKRSMELWNGLAKKKLDLTWDATNGLIASSCTLETVKALAESGCIAVSIGMESGNPNILRQIRKPGTVDNFIKAGEAFQSVPEIHARVFLMIGFPGETMSMIYDTIKVAKEMNMDWCSTTVLQPLPNTPIYDSMIAQGLVKPMTGDKEVRFNAGGYGKQTEIDTGSRYTSSDFREAFNQIKLNEKPNATQLNDIWFYMNYHLNFQRLFYENRKIKIKQQLQNLTALGDIISPEHGFALYFRGVLEYKLNKKIDFEIISRLKNILKNSAYWNDRLASFGLNFADLENKSFLDQKFSLKSNYENNYLSHEVLVTR